MVYNERYRGIYIYDDIRIEGGIPRIVSDELFFKVQKRLKSHRVKRKSDADYLLTGKLFCGKCKKPMIGLSGTSKAGGRYFYYVCSEKRHNGRCNKRNIPRDVIEDAVACALKENMLTDEMIEWIADKTVEYNKSTEASAELSLFKAELSSVNRAIGNLMSAIEQGIITDTTKERLLELESQKKSLERKILIAKSEVIDVPRDVIIEGLSMYRDGDVQDKEYQRQLFYLFLVAVYVYDDELRIFFSYSGNKEITVPFKEHLDSVRLNSPMDHQCHHRRTPFMQGDMFVVCVRMQ